MNYSLIISDEDFVWSYSRIKSFEDCPYGWLLKYIKRLKGKEQFFSQYGSFNHLIHELYYSGDLTESETADYYLFNFTDFVTAKAPSLKIYEKYFKAGANYWKNFSDRRDDVVGVEEEVEFTLDGKKFTGFVDLVRQNDKLSIVDHKSRDLKPRSGKSKPTASDKELDAYFRQLYLYSVPIAEKFSQNIEELSFNCFKENLIIKELFDEHKFEEAKQWALDNIQKITNNEEWKPKLDWFKCKYICDMSDECEYFEMLGKK